SGTPLISDPGYKLVREARKRQIAVKVIPGATAAIAALSVSGLPTDKFLFLGYPPEKKSHRLKLFQNLLKINQLIETTYVFYCAPHKLIATLLDLQEVLGNREIVIARELTKIHEEIWHGEISEALEYFTKVKGEIVVLFHSN
ncbi:MAG: SAM-dependent methyltransferase, partial [Patescibacteria group bacterium]